MPNRFLHKSILLAFLSSSLLMQSCGEGPGGSSTVGAEKEIPVKTLKLETVTVHRAYPATVEGIQTIELRPRVEGYLEEIFVDEGARVEKGQPLFKINADEFNQQVNSAMANVAVAEAQVNTAKMEVEKQRPLVEKGIVSEYSLTSAQYTLQSAEATLKQTNAALDNARTNLNYTVVKSPADGIIGVFPYRIGSLVSSAISEPLTIISDISEVRVYFAVNEKDFIDLSKHFIKHDEDGNISTARDVSLILADGSTFPEKGVIDAVAGIISQSTGSATIRATFDNPDELLRSGSSATVRIPSILEGVLVVPQAATYEIQNKTFVYKVGEDNVVTNQEVTVQAGDDGKDYLITSGLQAGDVIVTDGINALSAGMKISPVSESNK